MRTTTTTFEQLGGDMLLLGYKGDNKATEIYINCAHALREYCGTTAAMSITGPDGTVYPGDFTIKDGIVRWPIQGRDTKYAGAGSVRVDLVDDCGRIVNSAEAKTAILRTNATGIAPDQVTNWTDAASVALEEVKWALGFLMKLGGIAHFEIGDDGYLYYYFSNETPVMFEIVEGDLYVYEHCTAL